MTAQYNQERQTDRRQQDKDCKAHETRLDVIDRDVASNKGWLKGSAALLSVVAFVLSTFCTIIIGKLTGIEALLSDSKVMLKAHEIEITSLKQRTQDIEDRHKFIDQSPTGNILRRWIK
jgi:hypothetical protein